MNPKSIPRWKRLGFQNDGEYRAAISAKKRTEKAALAATSAKGETLHILENMWAAADYHAPRVTITKEQLMARCRVSVKTVKRAWKTLREEGSILPVANWQGGKGVPTTFRLRVAGFDQTPSDAQVSNMEAKRDREAAWRFLRGKYGPMKALEILGPEDQE